jgi:hypothetical protein
MSSPRMLGRVVPVRTDVSNDLQLLVAANVVPSSPILFTLMMDVIHFSETPIYKNHRA